MSAASYLEIVEPIGFFTLGWVFALGCWLMDQLLL